MYVNQYVCMYVCVCIYVYMYTCIYVYLYIFILTHLKLPLWNGPRLVPYEKGFNTSSNHSLSKQVARDRTCSVKPPGLDVSNLVQNSLNVFLYVLHFGDRVEGLGIGGRF